MLGKAQLSTPRFVESCWYVPKRVCWILLFLQSVQMKHDQFWYPNAPWCWNMNPNICPNKITQFCRFLYTSTMVRIWDMSNKSFNQSFQTTNQYLIQWVYPLSSLINPYYTVDFGVPSTFRTSKSLLAALVSTVLKAPFCDGSHVAHCAVRLEDWPGWTSLSVRTIQKNSNVEQASVIYHIYIYIIII